MEDRRREWRVCSSSYSELRLHVKFGHFVHLPLVNLVPQLPKTAREGGGMESAGFPERDLGLVY